MITRKRDQASSEPTENSEAQEPLTENPENLVDQELVTLMASLQADNIIARANTIKINLENINNVVDKLAQYKNISKISCAMGIPELFRQGGANAGASAMLSVVNCPEYKTPNCYISKNDVIRTMEIVLRHKAFRKLAEAMAPIIIATNLARIKRNPTDIKGDLAACSAQN